MTAGQKHLITLLKQEALLLKASAPWAADSPKLAPGKTESAAFMLLAFLWHFLLSCSHTGTALSNTVVNYILRLLSW